MSGFPDPIATGLERGWKVHDTADPNLASRYEFDVAIVGTGAGGGISAEILARSGLSVVMIEEGPLRSSRDFDMRESAAYPSIYQESAARKTKDKAINILQGRCVGGSTTVNWTSCFRPPDATLAFWRDRYGLSDLTPQAMLAWYLAVERRLSISLWSVPPNVNNDILRRGAAQFGIPAPAMARNVRNCFNLGYCGTGCPTNAKQSMLVTTIPVALDHGATLFTRARAQRLMLEGRRPTGLEVQWLDEQGLRPSGRSSTVVARHYVLSGGAINTPALLLRSKVADPARLIGARTFLHPSVVSAAVFDERVDAFDGAPQSIYSDHFLGLDDIAGPIGFKLEVPPIHPVLFSTTMNGFGNAHFESMKRLRNTHAMIALLRDGFHPQSRGGRVELRADSTPVLDYPLNAVLFDGARRALLKMAELQFAAGAKTVQPVHELGSAYSSWASAKTAIESLPMEPILTRVVSAHVMGGSAMSADPATGVTRPDGRLHGLDDVSVHDGSIFPTSIGANPQLSIYAITARLSDALASTLTGRAAAQLA
ncbi:MAG: GMC family oxidoreductase [Burkholderiaceae bacterium]|nr:GMC family oxidoreductase [Burkholderiaceae bacterium]